MTDKIATAIDTVNAAALAADTAVQAFSEALRLLAEGAELTTLSADDAAAIAWAPQLVKNIEGLLIEARRNANLCRIHAS